MRVSFYIKLFIAFIIFAVLGGLALTWFIRKIKDAVA